MVSLKPKKGKLLIAEPSITGDHSFSRSVVLLAEHNSEGSIGFILNKPLEYDISDLIPEIKIPFKVFNFLGYSGWDSLQLDQELSSKSWVVVKNEYESNIIGKSDSAFWREKMVELGGDYIIWSNAPENPTLN